MDNSLVRFRADILQRLGCAPSDIVGDGKIHRFPTSQNGRDDAGWYQFYADDFPAGSFGDWRMGAKYKWMARETLEMSPQERERLEELKAERQKKTEAAYEAAAGAARLQFSNAKPARADHGYLIKKGVVSHGLRENYGRLLVPVSDGESIVSLQTIDNEGKKLFVAGSRVAGGFHLIGDISEVLIIGEGYATCATINEATGLAVVVAFNAGNLEAVATKIRQKYPSARIVIAADDDHATEKERGFNPGLRDAKKAADLVNGVVAVPPFDREKDGEKLSDWNDFSAVRGKAVMAAAFKEILDKMEIVRLASLAPIDYDREREKIAKSLGVRVSTVDSQVKAKREETADKAVADLCRDIKPCAEAVDVAELLNAVRGTIARFIVCDQSTTTAATLWIAFTWIIDHVQVAPLAVITAPEKRCGKTQLLDLIGRLSRRNLFASNISPAATFRVIEAKSPTLLIDEADAFFRENEELRGVINSGHTRTSAYVIRTVGDDFEVKQFSTWGAKAIAGIGKLSDTVMDRAVVLPLRRKHSSEKVERLRHAEAGTFEMLASKLARFGEDHGEAIGRARPNLPDALNDRAQDNWESLLAIADLAGGAWPKEARRAALAISGDGKDELSTSEELLSDIRDVFAADLVDRISLAELLKRLIEDETAPWVTWNRGKPMTTRQLGKRLGEFGISAKAVHISSYEKPKGFHKSQFADAWARYLDGADNLSPETPVSSVTQSPLGKSAALEVTGQVTGKTPIGHQCARSPSAGKVTEREVTESEITQSPLWSPENPIFSRQGDQVTGQTPPAAKETSDDMEEVEL
jgi:putative DNA primase/helicase